MSWSDLLHRTLLVGAALALVLLGAAAARETRTERSNGAALALLRR